MVVPAIFAAGHFEPRCKRGEKSWSGNAQFQGKSLIVNHQLIYQWLTGYFFNNPVNPVNPVKKAPPEAANQRTTSRAGGMMKSPRRGLDFNLWIKLKSNATEVVFLNVQMQYVLCHSRAGKGFKGQNDFPFWVLSAHD